MLNQLKKMQSLFETHTAFVSCTLVEIKGSSPRSQGGRMLVTEDGLIDGTIGGGLVEAKAIDFSKEYIKKKNPSEQTQFVQWNLNKDTGMSCGGTVKLFFEVFNNNLWKIAVFGAGHISQALIPLLTNLECQLLCIDDRQEWLDKLPDSPKLEKKLVENHVDIINDIDPATFVVLMTQGHKNDLKIIRCFLERMLDSEYQKQAYLGVIGSRSKASILKSELKKEGFNEEQLDSYFCPLGLSLGGNHPQEIAISISAQLLYERDQLFDTVHTRNPIP